MTVRIAILCAVAWAAAGNALAQQPSWWNRAKTDYLLHCSGCHGQDGRGLESKGIPALQDQVGYLLRAKGGRAFVMQVPGLLSAGMLDDRAAGVTNYIILRFAGASMPEKFSLFDAKEAKRFRETRPANIPEIRRALAAELSAAGYAIR